MKLIPDWRLAWRFASVQAALLLALLSGLQAEVLPLVVPLFPEHAWPWVSGGLALAVVVLRLMAQPDLEIPRAELELDRLDAPTQQPMPAGRLERYLGAFLVATILLVFAIGAWFIWAMWGIQ